MLTHDVLETQTALELPAREMLAFFNWAYVTQAAQNNSTQANVLGIGQANVSGQSNTQVVVIGQS